MLTVLVFLGLCSLPMPILAQEEDIEDIEDVEDVEDIEDVEDVEDVEDDVRPAKKKKDAVKPKKKPDPPKEKPPPPPSPPPPAKEPEELPDDELMDEFALLEEEMKSDEVESASKHRQSIFWSPSAITVFTREDIRSSGAITLPDLLRRVPGFDVYELKPSCPLVGSRALTDDSNNLILALVDGREAMIELSGFPVWAALTFDLTEVERVEVIRGPGSTLYGANAFAGVVNITTVSDRHEGGGDVYISGGEEGYHRLFGRVGNSFSLGDGTLSFSAGIGTANLRSASDRYNDIKLVRIRTHGYVRYQQGRKLDLSLHAGISEGDGSLYIHVGDVQAVVLSHFVMAKAKSDLTDDLSLKAQLYHNRYDADFHILAELQAYGIWLARFPDFYTDINTLDGQVQLDYRAGDNLLLTGGAPRKSPKPGERDSFMSNGVHWKPGS
jgi:outer membrane receptor protein involved in Fe transport